MKRHEGNFNLFTCIASQGSWKAKIIIPIFYFRKLGLGEAEQPQRLTGLEKCICAGLGCTLQPIAWLTLPRGQ